MFPITFFTIFLAGYALVIVTFIIFASVTTGNNCTFAFTWLDGWFEGRSAFQVFAASMLSIIILYIVRMFSNRMWRERPFETTVQGIFIIALSSVYVSMHAFLFPYGHWARSSAIQVLHWAFPIETAFVSFGFEEPDWPYDFPEPPEKPSDDPVHDPQIWELFGSPQSPNWFEFAKLGACAIDYLGAIELYWQYWDDFDEYYRELELQQLKPSHYILDRSGTILDRDRKVVRPDEGG